MRTTLVIPTYNWPEALELVLLSYKRQSRFTDEVIIADDGSTNDTRQLINSFKKDFPTELRHIWQEDEGFKKGAILNKAIASAKGDYIIQIDGDCIMHRHFIKDHILAVEKNTYLFGSRVSLKKFYVPKVFEKKKIDFSFFSNALIKRGRSIYLPILGKGYKPELSMSSKVRGCNLSYWKEDYISVNGYNEDIFGWGREDTEFVLRMFNNKVLGKRLKFRGIVFHIWHNEFSKNRLSENSELQAQTINNKAVWCDNGIDKYLSE